MSDDAQYSVIRYIPDPGRGERLNIGILIWEQSSHDYRLSLDEEAIKRVIRENPRLELDALLYIEPMLLEQLSSAASPAESRIATMLATQSGFPLELADPLSTTVGDGQEGLDEKLDKLLKRIVHPKRRGHAGSYPRPKDEIAKILKPLIRSHAVSRRYALGKTKTGISRHVDFFANSGANVALDVLQLAVTKADEIRNRADAKAMKVTDCLGGKEVNDFVVYCEFASDRHLEDVYGEARTVIEAQGARVFDDLDVAASVLSDAAAKTR